MIGATRVSPLCFASLGFHGHLLPRLAWLHAAPTPTPISCWFWLPETQISVLLKAPLPPQLSQPAMALASLPPSLQRRPHAVASDDAKGGDELEAATAYLARKPVSDHTDDFLASCAVVVSSLLPPFAKTIKCKSRVSN